MRRSCCGGGPYPSPRSQPPPAPKEVDVSDMQDSDFVMVDYLSGNKGSHGVIGVAVFARQFEGVNMRRVRGGWSFDYGYHCGGDRFMIHRKDAEMAPHLYRIVEAARGIGELPKRWSPPPPPEPSRIAATALPPAPSQSLDLEEEVAALRRAKEERGFTLEIIPGITPKVAEQLRANGIDSEAKLLALGEDGLQEYQGVGPTKARIIMEYLAKKNG